MWRAGAGARRAGLCLVSSSGWVASAAAPWVLSDEMGCGGGGGNAQEQGTAVQLCPDEGARNLAERLKREPPWRWGTEITFPPPQAHGLPT